MYKNNRPKRNNQPKKLANIKPQIDKQQFPINQKISATSTSFDKQSNDYVIEKISSKKVLSISNSNLQLLQKKQIFNNQNRREYVNILSKGHYRHRLRHQTFIRSVLILDKFMANRNINQIKLGSLFACFFLAAKTEQIYMDGFNTYSKYFHFQSDIKSYLKYQYEVLAAINFDVEWKDGPYYYFIDYKQLYQPPNNHIKYFIQYLLEIICLNPTIYQQFSWKLIVNTIYLYLQSPLIINKKFTKENENCLKQILLTMKSAIQKDYIYIKYSGIRYQHVALCAVPRIRLRSDGKIQEEQDQFEK